MTVLGKLERLKEVFFTNAEKAERCIALIPSRELASFNIAQWLQEKLLDGYPLTCLSEAQHTISLLTANGSDINAYTKSVVLQNGQQRKYTGTLAHFLANFGYSNNPRLAPADSHASFVQFLAAVDRMGLDFDLLDGDEKSALDLATLIDERDGNASSIVNRYIRSRDLARRLEANLSTQKGLSGNGGKL
ncbi:hypothetical protein AWB71_01333 [Caballeronia peredens]|nr:hypothetical protein AWB71_01333 [Caballeronia peredens]